MAVRSGESATVNVRLEVGPASERIQVVAQAPLLDGASFEMAVKSERFLELPIRDGNPVMLAVLAAGVVNVSEGGTYRPYDNENSPANANSFFSNKSGSGKDDFRENRWGVNANGPVEIPGLYNGHNRTFWMYGYEGISASQP